MSKFTPESFDYNPDLTSSTILFSSSSFSVTPYSLTLGSPTSFSVTENSNTYTHPAVINNTDVPYISDVLFQTNDQVFSVVEQNIYQLTLDLWCSKLGINSISFSLEAYLGTSVPSWILIDTISGWLSITTPEIIEDKEYDFYINSLILGYSYSIPKIIKIKVKNWSIQNWIKCSSSSSSMCISWNTGYNLVSGLCKVIQPKSQSTSSNAPSSTAESIKKTSQSIFASTSGVVVLFSLINFSSVSSIWSMANQIQIFFLLLLTRAYIPVDIVTVITGMDIILNPTNYLQSEKISIFDSTLENFKFELSNSELNLLDIKSSSTIYNILPSLKSIIYVMIVHLIVALLYKIFKSLNEPRKWRKFWFVWKWIIYKAFIILTFGYYIRYILEINQYALISSVNEIYYFNFSNAYRIASFTIAIILAMLWLVLVFIVFWISLSSYEVVEDMHNLIGEFYSGIKMSRKAKLYVVVLMTRRVLFVVLLITITSLSSQYLIAILWFKINNYIYSSLSF